jgi:hypothetical protein
MRLGAGRAIGARLAPLMTKGSQGRATPGDVDGPATVRLKNSGLCGGTRRIAAQPRYPENPSPPVEELLELP